MNIGIVFGCFIPLHKGHIFMINRALSENDKIILGVCGYPGDRGKGFIPFEDRIALVRNKFKDNSKVIISIVNDKKIGLSGKFDEEAWRIWSEELFSGTKYSPDDTSNTFTWYTGEQSYINEIQKTFNTHKFVLLDRQSINISGTDIRGNPKEYLDYIDEDFKAYLKEKGVLS